MSNDGSTPTAARSASRSSSHPPPAAGTQEWRWLPLRFAELLNCSPESVTRRWGVAAAMREEQRERMLREVYTAAATLLASASLATLIVAPRTGASLAAACAFAASAAFLYAAVLASPAEGEEEEEAWGGQPLRAQREGHAGEQRKEHVGAVAAGGFPTYDEVLSRGAAPRAMEPVYESRTVEVIDPERDEMERLAAPVLISYDDDVGEDEDEGMTTREVDERTRLDMALRTNVKGGGRRKRMALLPTALQKRMVRAGEGVLFNDDASVTALDAPNVPAFLKLRDTMKGDARGGEDGVLASSWSAGATRTGIEYFSGEEAGDDPFEQQHMFTSADGTDPMFPSLPPDAITHEQGVEAIYRQTLDKDRLSVWRQSLPSVAIQSSAEQMCRMNMAMADEKADLASQAAEMHDDFLNDTAFSKDNDARADFDNFFADMGPEETDPMLLKEGGASAALNPAIGEVERGMDPLFRDV